VVETSILFASRSPHPSPLPEGEGTCNRTFLAGEVTTRRLMMLPLLGWILALAVYVEPASGADEGQGGLADLSAQDVAALREARQWLQERILDPNQPQPQRRQEIDALARIHEALADWGTEGQADWYFQTMTTFDNESLRDLLAALAEASAKGPVCHLAGVRAFWQQVDAKQGGELPVYLRAAHNRFVRMTREWEKPAKPTAGLLPLKTSTARLDPPKMLAPLRAAAPRLDLPKQLAPQKVAPQRIDFSKVLKPYPAP
jgi:hypothetical protein